MKKQTVEQRYVIQQMMSGKPMPSDVAAYATKAPQQIEAQKVFNNMKQALQQAQQTTQQVKLVNPSETSLTMVDQQLLYAQQQLQQLETASLGLSAGTKQQIAQLQLQIQTALGTLQSIQQALG